MTEEATVELQAPPPTEATPDRAADERSRRYNIYQEMGGRVAQETYERMLGLLEDMKPQAFNKAQAKTYEHHKLLARGYATLSHIATTPQTEDLFSVLRENLEQKDLIPFPGEDEPFWSDQRVMAETLLMSGDLPKYRTFIRSLPDIFKRDRDPPATSRT